MSIAREQVQRVALLARLALSDEELDVMTGQLDEIVAYIDQLSEVPTDGVDPMAHALDLSNVFAQDRTEPSLSRARALANAPCHDGRFYKVPAVLGD